MISRVALQATTSSSGKKSAGKDDDHNIYAGDIFLRFKHIPSGVHATVEGMLFVQFLEQGLQYKMMYVLEHFSIHIEY